MSNTWDLATSEKSFISQLLSNETGNKLLSVFSNQIFISSDYGSTWSSGKYINTDNNITCIAANRLLNSIVVAGSLQNGGPDYIYRSSDSGETFQPLTNSPSAPWSIITSDNTGENLVAGQANNAYKKIYYSNNYGESWNESTNIPELFWYLLVSSGNGEFVVAIGYNDTHGIIYYSNDFGQSFTEYGPLVIPNYRWIQKLACNNSGQYLYAAIDVEGVYKSSDYGVNWSLAGASFGSGEVYTSISCDQTGQYVILYDLSVYNTYISSDYGETWVLQNIPGTFELGDGSALVHMSPDASVKYSVTSNVGIFRTYPLTSTSQVACFNEDTKILTNRGYIPIQHLKKGDKVKTFKHGFIAINMIGRRDIQNIPGTMYIYTEKEYHEITDNLILTKHHSILVNKFREGEKVKTQKELGKIYVTDGKYRLPACADNKANLFKTPGLYTIYHIALEHDDYYMNYGIYANGLLVESCSKRFLKELSGMELL